MSKQVSLRPILCIDLKKNRIRIHKQTLHLLGDPKYIQLLINPNTQVIAIRKNVKEDYLAHRITSKQLAEKNCYELYSHSLIDSLKQININLQTNHSYRIYGTYNSRECIATFSMSQTTCITNI